MDIEFWIVQVIRYICLIALGMLVTYSMTEWQFWVMLVLIVLYGNIDRKERL